MTNHTLQSPHLSRHDVRYWRLRINTTKKTKRSLSPGTYAYLINETLVAILQQVIRCQSSGPILYADGMGNLADSLSSAAQRSREWHTHTWGCQTNVILTGARLSSRFSAYLAMTPAGVDRPISRQSAASWWSHSATEHLTFE